MGSGGILVKNKDKKREQYCWTQVQPLIAQESNTEKQMLGKRREDPEHIYILKEKASRWKKRKATEESRDEQWNDNPKEIGKDGVQNLLL